MSEHAEETHPAHTARPDLRHVRVVAGMSPLSVQAELDGKPWHGLVDLTFRVGMGRLCEVTATFYANIDFQAEVQETESVVLTNDRMRSFNKEPHV